MLLCFSVLVFVLSFFGCGGNTDPLTTAAPQGSSVRDTSRAVSSEAPEETVETKAVSTGTSEAVGKTEATGASEETGRTETASSETATDIAVEPAPVRSFGKIVSETVAAVNRATAENASGVFDVLGDLGNINTVDAVVSMIEAYTFPNKATYGTVAFTDEIKAGLIDETNLEALKALESFSVRYGILTDNADVRSFPTAERATDTGGAEEYDFLQETKLCLGSGVIVLWESKSGEYFFVQGYNYNGWVKRETVALTSEEEFRSFLMPDNFLVCTSPVQSDPLKRLGEILPITAIENDLYTYAVPVRNTEGNLKIELHTAPRADLMKNYHEGFLDWSEETCVELMRSLIDFPYGWGDTNNAYDCSSTIGSVYQCFGFVLPRNTGILKYFAVHCENVEGKTYAELKDMIASHPSAILVFKGHALMSCGIRTYEDGTKYVSIVHNTRGWNVPDGDGYRYVYKWCVTDSCPEEMLNANGEMTLDHLTAVIWVEE